MDLPFEEDERLELEVIWRGNAPVLTCLVASGCVSDITPMTDPRRHAVFLLYHCVSIWLFASPPPSLRDITRG